MKLDYFIVTVLALLAEAAAALAVPISDADLAQYEHYAERGADTEDLWKRKGGGSGGGRGGGRGSGGRGSSGSGSSGSS